MKTRFTLLALTALALTFSLPAIAQSYKYSNLYSFKNNATDPSLPSALIIDGSGNLYGTALNGGTFGSGVVYEISPKGTLKLLYSFNGNSSLDAALPLNLARDREGNLYGDTEAISKGYVGDLFKLAPNGNGTYSFSSLYVAPDMPEQMVVDSAGDVYWLNCGYNGSVTCDQNTMLNKIVKGTNTTLYEFTSIGFFTSGNYIIDKSGDIYGTEYGDDSTSFGLVYKWSPVSGYSVVHAFNGTDGYGPTGLRQDASGNVYGVTASGGTTGYGTVFKISPTGAFTTLYNFCSKANCADVSYPFGPLTVDSSGNIFGVLNQGVFKLTSGRTETLLYSSGSVLLGPGLVMDKSGNLYGTTTNGGSAGRGSVYKLTKQ
jgi:uncharacterized repeat protein (TIGR03803 family)